MIRSCSLLLLSFVVLAGFAGCDGSATDRPTPPIIVDPPTAGPRSPTATRTATLPLPATATPTATSPVPSTATAVPTMPPTATPSSTLVPATPAPGASRIEVRRAFVSEANTVTVEVALVAGGTSVGGMQNDLVFDHTVLGLAAASSCRIVDAIGDRQPGCDADPVVGPCKTMARSLVTCGASPQPIGCPAGAGADQGRFRAILAATAVPNRNPIPDGVLYTCDFEIRDRARLPQAIRNLNVIASNPSGAVLTQFVPVDGLVTVRARLAQAAALGGTEIFVLAEDAAGLPVSGVVDVLGQLVTFTRDGARLTLGAPLARSAPIGAELFVVPTGLAPTPLPGTTATPTPPSATPTATATFPSTGDPDVVISIGRVRADSTTVAIEVVLDAGPGSIVGGMQNDIVFDNTLVRLASAASCQINPLIGDRLPECEDEPGTLTAPCKTLSRLLVTCGGVNPPDGCPPGAGASVSRFRAIIGATAVPNANQIPNGLLYTCAFEVLEPNLLPADLEIGKVVVSNPTGGRIEPVEGVSGAVLPPSLP